MAIDTKTLAASKKYTDNSIAGGGAVKGKNAVVDSITDITGGHRVTFKWTLDNGTVQTQSMDVMDGVDGQDGAPGVDGHDGAPGADGLTPTIEVTEITGGHRVTITIGEETPEVFDVMDGAKGEDGDPGPAGQDGVGVPEGGTTGQVLKKKSGTDYDTEWADEEGGTGHGIPAGGTSGQILSKNSNTDYDAKWIDPAAYSQEQSDWSQSDSSKVDFIKNKPQNLVQDANYVHTDNNYDATAKGIVDGVTTALAGKVDVVSGKGLSTNDYTNEDASAVAALGTASTKDVAASGDASTTEVVMGNDSRLTDARNAADVSAWAKAANKPTYTASEVGAVATTAVGANEGVAPLNNSGKIDSAYLPSYVDDVLEYASISAFPATGESGKIYVALDTNKTYRWGSTEYVEISESLALGETSSTAYAGNKGAANATAIQGIKNGTTINSFGAVETALADYIKTSATSGLVKNDGTIDTTAYQDSTDKMSVADMADVLTPLPSARGNWQEYSTTEHRVGTWIDGKPVYEKTFETTLPEVTTSGTATNSYVSIGAIVDKVVDLKGAVYHGATQWVMPIIGDVASSKVLKVRIGVNNNSSTITDHKNSIRIESNWETFNNMDCSITVQYTKVTS